MKKILMGSLVLTVLAAAIITVQMSSCTKTTAQTTTIHDTVKVVVVDSVCPTPKYPITGLWVGTSSDATTNNLPFNLSVKADGTCTAEGIAPGTQENFGYGTWSLSDTTFTYSLTWVYGYSTNVGVKGTYTAIFNSTAATLTSGTWHIAAPSGATDNGIFSMSRSN